MFNAKAKHKEGKRAVLYLRVSTEEQVDNFSLGTQEEICRREALRRGFEIVTLFKEEGRSAKTITGRPVLLKMLEFCRKNKKSISAVFVYRLDRISRQTQNYLTIREKLAQNGISLLSATEPTDDTPTGKFIEQILAANAELENNIRSERAKNGLYARFQAGLMSNKPPLGYKWVNGFAVKDPESFDKVKAAWDIMTTGTKSLRQMAEIMNTWGLRITMNKKNYSLRWQAAQRIFRSKFYMGKLVSRTYQEEVAGQHAPMITEEQFNKVQVILNGRSSKNVSITRIRDNLDFPLRRLIGCNKCGASLTAAWSMGRRRKYPYYWCAKRCNSKSIRAIDLENAVIVQLQNMQWTPKAIEFLLFLITKKYKQRLAIIQRLNKTGLQTIDSLKAQQQTLIEKNLSGVYSDEIFIEQNNIFKKKLQQAQLTQSNSFLELYSPDKVNGIVSNFASSINNLYKRLDIGQKRVLFSLIFRTKPLWRYSGLTDIHVSKFINISN